MPFLNSPTQYATRATATQPMVSYNTTTTPATSSFDQFYNFYNAASAPQNAFNQASMSQLQNQLGFNQANYGLQSQYANQNYGLQSQLLGINQAQNQVQQNSIPRQSAYYDLLNSLANQGYDLSGQAATQNADVAKRSQISQGTAAGALQAGGVRNRVGDISSQLQNQLGQIGVNRAQTNAQTAEQKAQLADSRKNLDLIAKQYGVQGAQLKTALDQKLAELGLSNYTNANDIFANITKLSATQQAQVMDIINQSISAAGMFPGAGGKATTTTTRRTIG